MRTTATAVQDSIRVAFLLSFLIALMPAVVAKDAAVDPPANAERPAA